MFYSFSLRETTPARVLRVRQGAGVIVSIPEGLSFSKLLVETYGCLLYYAKLARLTSLPTRTSERKGEGHRKPTWKNYGGTRVEHGIISLCKKINQ